jgi:glycosyltransferase involved in cell wall biosynthesis
VPAFNVELFLDRCIYSILKQTYTNFELILIDDGSTDSSGHICDSYVQTDRRVKVIHQSNKGQSDARNTGLDIARGQFISFIDADDYISEKMIETLFLLISNFSADISECGFKRVVSEKEIECEFGNGLEYGQDNFLIEKFLKEDIFYGVCTKLFKASVFQNKKFPVGRIYEDTWMTLNLCLDKYKYARTSEPLYFYYQRPNSTLNSTVTPRKAREFIYILENQLNLIESRQLNKQLSQRLITRIKEKSVFWYLDLVLSDQIILRRIYAKIYASKLNYSVFRCLISSNIPIRNKMSYLFCRIGFSAFIRIIKKF